MAHASARLEDGAGRPLQVRAPVRNRLRPDPEGSSRKVYHRTVNDISYVSGTARWFLEDIDVTFRALGYARFPQSNSLDMVGLEVVDGVDKGWVRIDPDTVEYTEKNDDQSQGG